jgi:hypothetical protein
MAQKAVLQCAVLQQRQQQRQRQREAAVVAVVVVVVGAAAAVAGWDAVCTYTGDEFLEF